METLIITKEGNVFKTVPNMTPKKLTNGNWTEIQEGVKLTGCPLCRIPFYGDATRANPVLDMLRTTFNLVETA